jgi:imidazolonepropionase-like amidohydrolase
MYKIITCDLDETLLSMDRSICQRNLDAIRAATVNPALAIGAFDKIGSIETGKLADFIVCSEDYSSKRVFKGGKEI